jgi:hypothetical protein
MSLTQPWEVRLRCGGYADVMSANRLAGTVRAADETCGSVLDDRHGAWLNELNNRYVPQILVRERHQAKFVHRSPARHA